MACVTQLLKASFSSAWKCYFDRFMTKGSNFDNKINYALCVYLGMVN